MDDDAHIGLVDAHAEGVGGDDDLEVAGDEGLLDVLFQAGIEPGMEMGAGPAHVLEEGGDFLGTFAPRGKDHGAAVAVTAPRGAKFLFQQAVDQRVLFRLGDRDDFVMEVFPLDDRHPVCAGRGRAIRRSERGCLRPLRAWRSR